MLRHHLYFYYIIFICVNNVTELRCESSKQINYVNGMRLSKILYIKMRKKFLPGEAEKKRHVILLIKKKKKRNTVSRTRNSGEPSIAGSNIIL